jgi:NTE family protein
MPEALQHKIIGIALSGGGARGLAHIGVLAALEDLGIYPNVIAGTSMGAIIGAFYASGYKPSEMLKIAKKQKLYRMLRWSLPKGGMLSMTRLRQLLEEHIRDDSFESLEKKLLVTASNISSGEYVVFDKGPLFRAVIASASIPVIFEPQLIDGQTYVDGGLFLDLPVSPLTGLCDRIIASNVNYNGPQPQLNNIKSIAERVYRLAIYNNIRKDLDLCHLIIDPPDLREHGTFDFKNIENVYEIGYKETEKVARKWIKGQNLNN